MKRFWMRALLCFALSAALLTGCALSPSSQPAESPTDPLTGQELVWPGQRPVAIAIDNAAASTTQWGLSTASLVLEALTAQQQSTRLCLVYPAVGAVPGLSLPGRTSTGGCWWASRYCRCSGAADSLTRTTLITTLCAR